MLFYLQFDKKFEIHMDASNFAINEVLMQNKKTCSIQKYKFEWELVKMAHSSELYAMVHYLKTGKHYLGGRKTKVYTNNISFKYFM